MWEVCFGKRRIRISPPSSSPISEKGGIQYPGGIDFRALPIVTQPMPTIPLGSVPLGRQENYLAGTDPISINLEAEWQEIQKLIQADDLQLALSRITISAKEPTFL